LKKKEEVAIIVREGRGRKTKEDARNVTKVIRESAVVWNCKKFGR